MKENCNSPGNIQRRAQKSSKDYRPVSLTCVLSKCLDMIIKNQMFKRLVNRSAISTDQNGFKVEMPRHPNLPLLSDRLPKRLDESHGVHVCQRALGELLTQFTTNILDHMVKALEKPDFSYTRLGSFFRIRTFSVRAPPTYRVVCPRDLYCDPFYR